MAGSNPDHSGLAPEDAVTSSKLTATAKFRPMVSVWPPRMFHVGTGIFDKVQVQNSPSLYTAQTDIFVFTEAPDVNINHFLPGCSGIKIKHV